MLSLKVLLMIFLGSYDNIEIPFLSPRQVKQLEKSLGDMDNEYDACNLVYANGEVNGFDKKFPDRTSES